MQLTERQRQNFFNRFQTIRENLKSDIDSAIFSQAAIVQNPLNLSQDDVENHFRKRRFLVRAFEKHAHDWEQLHKEIIEAFKCP